MAIETAKTATRPDETLTDGSGSEPDPDPLNVSVSNGENAGDVDLVLKRRTMETEVTVEKIFGVEDEAALADEKENENESDSVMDMEKDGAENLSETNGALENVNASTDENRVVTEVKSELEEEEDGDDFADVSDKNHNYHVGDFVWGKIRSHPWWPGQIYYPSDASAYAAKLKQKNRLLVAYFGDGSFSWCHPSQLRPFVENFEQMSKQSSTKNFVYAVENALDEISRVVELETRKLYTQEENEIEVAKPVNAGIREEANVPEGSIGKLLVSQYGAVELLAIAREIACKNSVNSLLQFVVLKSWLSSFYFARGGYKLCSYSESINIEGLEDNNKNGNSIEEELIEKPAQKVQEVSGDKLYRRRKQKTVAELMKEDLDLYATSASTAKKRGRNKKKAEDVSESPGIQNGGVEKAESGKKKKKVNDEKAEEGLTLTSRSSAEKDDDDDDVKLKDETAKSNLSREKKKSRYLSPPYMDLKRGIKNSNSKKDSETDSEKIPDIGVRMTKAASLLISGSPAISKCSSGQKSSSKLPEESSAEKNSQTRKKDQEPNINYLEIGPTPNEVLYEVRSVAINPLRMIEEKNLEIMTGFFSAYRNSVFVNGSNYKFYNKGKKRKSSSNSESEHMEVKNGSKKKKAKQAAENASSGCTEGSSGGTKNNKEAHKKDLPALIVTFPPGFSLPSKDDIIKKFSKFGALNEAETDVFYNSFCARLVFVNSSDAEEAFNISIQNNPFGAANVNFRLRYPSSAQKDQKVPSSVEKIPDNSISESDGEALRLGFVKQKLEVITKMVEDSGEEISEELKSELEGEVKGLLEKVSDMMVSISS